MTPTISPFFSSTTSSALEILTLNIVCQAAAAAQTAQRERAEADAAQARANKERAEVYFHVALCRFR